MSESNGHRRICLGRGCGVDLTGMHGHRKWCSERCRRRTLYTNICECGAEIYNGSAHPPSVCGQCKHDADYGERNELLREMWEADEPAWYIAQELGMTEAAVITWVDSRRWRHGEKLNLRRLGGKAEERERRHRWMVALRGQGYSNAEIAEIVGMASRESVAVAFGHMRRKGWDVPPAPNRGASQPLVSEEEFVAAVLAGGTQAEVAQQLGYASSSGVSARAKRLKAKGVLA